MSCGEYSNQAQMNDCAQRKAKQADALLRATYQKLLISLKGNRTATAKVVQAQRAWVAFRDAEMAAEWPVSAGEDAQVLYGSVHPFCYAEMLEALTMDRVKTLRARMVHDEGDVCAAGS